MLKEEKIICEIMLLGYVRLKAARHTIERVFADIANEARRFELLRCRLLLITQLAERIDYKTLHNCKQNDDHEEEERSASNVYFWFVCL